MIQTTKSQDCKHCQTASEMLAHESLPQTLLLVRDMKLRSLNRETQNPKHNQSFRSSVQDQSFSARRSRSSFWWSRSRWFRRSRWRSRWGRLSKLIPETIVDLFLFLSQLLHGPFSGRLNRCRARGLPQSRLSSGRCSCRFFHRLGCFARPQSRLSSGRCSCRFVHRLVRRCCTRPQGRLSSGWCRGRCRARSQSRLPRCRCSSGEFRSMSGRRRTRWSHTATSRFRGAGWRFAKSSQPRYSLGPSLTKC